MTDSNARDYLDEKHEGDCERRIEAVKRWVEYIKSEPPEKWGPQQNAIVNGQLDAARSVGVSAEHRKRVEEITEEITEGRDDPDQD